MKLLKNLASLALLIIISVEAKQMGKITTTTQTGPQIQPSATEDRQKQQLTKAKTFEQLFNEVKNAKNAWDNTTQLLNETFVNNLVTNAKAAKIGINALNFLLNTARDYHAQFTGPKKDIDILHGFERQREAIVNRYELL